MDEQQKGQQSGAEQQNQKNPTLKEQGTQVPDYGNVMGGSADKNVEQGRQSGKQGGSDTRSSNADTKGNP